MEIFQKNPLQIENSGKKIEKSKNSKKLEKIEKSTLLRISMKKSKKSRSEKKVEKKMKSLRFRQDGVLGSAAQLCLETVSLGQIRNTTEAEYQFRPPIERRRRPHSWRGGENMKNIEK